MTKLARFTLTTALMGSLVFPALAQSSTTISVSMQPPLKTLPGLHHRAAGYPTHVHRIADAVRTPAVSSGSLPAVPTTAPSKGVAVDGQAAMTRSKPAIDSSTGIQGEDAMMDNKRSAPPLAPAAKPSVAAVSPSATAAPAPVLSAAPHGRGTTTVSPGLPRVQQ